MEIPIFCICNANCRKFLTFESASMQIVEIYFINPKYRNVDRFSISVVVLYIYIYISPSGILSLSSVKTNHLYHELHRPSPYNTKINIIKMTDIRTEWYLFCTVKLKCEYL